MSEEIKFCPFCGGEILKIAKKCRHCGKWLPKEEQKAECESLKTCPFCLGQVSTNEKKCLHCGEWLDNSEQKSIETKKCPSCCNEIPKDAKKCPHCGEWLEKKENKAVGCFINISIWGIVIVAFLVTIILGSHAEGIVNLLALIVLCIWLYFLPSEIANINKHRQTLWIFIINLFFGWSVIGWIALLVWACSDDN